MENTITKKVKQLSRTQQGISLTKENREIIGVEESGIVEVRKHKLIEDAKCEDSKNDRQ
ncbi:MAG TPA: hypothetical protein VMX17_06335 [Candidatus Glassbacteria bacterium]|nr:hypothetical protein [Candidatus Glassbacteria bacterium]